ncbi:MAG: hypothetical protein ACK2UW_02720 [Anaerolineales bacterium]|jgi:hypothetical protein
MEKMAVNQFKVRTNLRAGATYPDMSGVCNSSTTPPSNGQYPDMSGVCQGTNPPVSNLPSYPDMSGVCA